MRGSARARARVCVSQKELTFKSKYFPSSPYLALVTQVLLDALFLVAAFLVVAGVATRPPTKDVFALTQVLAPCMVWWWRWRWWCWSSSRRSGDLLGDLSLSAPDERQDFIGSRFWVFLSPEISPWKSLPRESSKTWADRERESKERVVVGARIPSSTPSS